MNRRSSNALPRTARLGGALPLADLAVLGLVVLTYFFFITKGTWWWQDGPRYFHELLGDAFAAGQLSLRVQPPPELLALPEPLDPRNRATVPFLHDASLFDGKYYVYWGPFPGLVHAVWQILTGHSLDQDIIQFAVLASAPIFFWWMLHRLRARYFANVPARVVPLLTVLVALNPVMIYLAGRPIHYHESIIFGLTMLVLSWLPLFAALADDRHARRYLLLSGLLVGCAIASRMPLVMYAVAIGGVLAARALVRRDRGLRHEALKLISFGAPVAIALALLFAYNYARFGSISEFGVGYQLQGHAEFYEVIQKPHRSVTSLRSIPPLLALYLVSAPAFTESPPYVRDVAMVPRSVGYLLGQDPIMVDAPLLSIFLIVPIVIFTPALPFLLMLRWRPDLEPVLTFMASLFLGAVLTLLLTCTTFGISFRYTADFVPALTMVASVMLLLLIDRFHAPADPSRGGAGHAVTRYLLAFTVLSLGSTIPLGVLFGLAAWWTPAPPWG